MKYRIGVTEAGDAGLDLSWTNKLRTNEVDGAIIITKNVCAEEFTCTLCECFNRKPNIVLHSTITGLPICLEPPCIPSSSETIEKLNRLILDEEFPRSNIVIRVDPIIPTQEGLTAAERVIRLAAEFGYRRFRVSVIDMYPHVRERFKKIGYPLPYGDGFAPSAGHLARVDNLLSKMLEEYPWIHFESCAEKLRSAEAIGCVSERDLELMGLDLSEIYIDNEGVQRKGCLCYSGKVELLNHRHRCPNQCAYCYWKD